MDAAYENHMQEAAKARLKAKQISDFTIQSMREILEISKRLQVLINTIETCVYSEANPNGFLLDKAGNYSMFLRLCKNKFHKKLEGDRKAWEDEALKNQGTAQEL